MQELGKKNTFVWLFRQYKVVIDIPGTFPPLFGIYNN